MITEPVKNFIFYLVIQKPGIFLRELTDEIKTTLGLVVSESAVCKFLKKAGLSRQKLALFALQRDDRLRRQFTMDVLLYIQESL